jgi:hypothetical protein
MSRIGRYLEAFRHTDRGDAEAPGLIQDAAGDSWVILPDGTRERLGNGGSLPAGGTAGQALIKASSTPGDTAWSTGLVFQLLTFVVNFDDPNFNDPNTGVLLWTPGAGDIISDLWVTITTAFAGADAAVLYIGGNIDFDGILTGTVDLIGLSAMSAFQDFTTGGGNQNNKTLDARSSWLHVEEDSSGASRPVLGLPCEVSDNGTAVIAAASVTNGPLTAGQMTVRAIVATTT